MTNTQAHTPEPLPSIEEATAYALNHMTICEYDIVGVDSARIVTDHPRMDPYVAVNVSYRDDEGAVQVYRWHVWTELGKTYGE
jgi:hypothetical protein